MSPLYQRIYLLVSQIPAGQVATYGQIAEIVGDCGAREVGYAMAAVPEERRVPWQRVLNREGRVSVRRSGLPSLSQRRLLEDEGVVFDAGERVDFNEYGWLGPSTAWLKRNDMHAVPPPWLRDRRRRGTPAI